MSTHAKPLWPIASRRSVGSVTTAMSARHSRTSASAPRLMCSSSTTAATMSRPRVQFGEHAGGGDHRGDAALHVLRAASVQPAVLDARRERIRHPLDADRVDVPAEHHRGPGLAAFEHADRRSAGPARPPASRRRDRPPHAPRARLPPPPLRPAAPGTSDGFTEFAATRSRRTGSGSTANNYPTTVWSVSTASYRSVPSDRIDRRPRTRLGSRLRDCRAITGASAGIGRACASASRVTGTRSSRTPVAPIACGRRRCHYARRRTRAGRAWRRHESRATCARWWHERVEAFGRLDVMICNAGIGFHGTLERVDAGGLEAARGLNVLGTLYAAHAAHDVFTRQGSGHLIAMSSVAGVRGVAGHERVLARRRPRRWDSSRACARSFSGHGHPRVGRVSGRPRARSSTTRCIRTSVTPCEGKGPRQDADDGRRGRRCGASRVRAARCFRTVRRGGCGIANAICAGADRPVHAAVQPAAPARTPRSEPRNDGR